MVDIANQIKHNENDQDKDKAPFNQLAVQCIILPPFILLTPKIKDNIIISKSRYGIPAQVPVDTTGIWTRPSPLSGMIMACSALLPWSYVPLKKWYAPRHTWGINFDGCFWAHP